MNKLYGLIILVAFVTFISCKKECEDEDGKLTTEELSWLSYSGGETLIFKSNNNETDTLKVSDKIKYDTPAPIASGSAGSCHPMHQSIHYTIASSILPVVPVVMDLYTHHKNEWTPDGKAYIMTSVSVFNFEDYSPQSNVLINGNTYNNVYIMTADTSLFNSEEIWRIYYTKQNGILRYDITHGEQWEKIN